MRQQAPLILGAGPAGCAAAITLGRAGVRAVLIDRDAEPRDQLCGGFLSWATAARLRGLGVDPAALGVHRVTRLTLCHAGSTASAALPQPCYGLSRRALDAALRNLAGEAGAEQVACKVTAMEPGRLVHAGGSIPYDTLFLATGKRDLRGISRSQHGRSGMIGLRLRAPASAGLSGHIELHLFDQGYAGIVQQEDGSANICLAIDAALLREADGKPVRLLEELARSHPRFADRLGGLPDGADIQTIGTIPYGWIANRTDPGLFRLGDQAVVIPSIAGEGIGIALESGIRGAAAWCDGGRQASASFQRDLSGSARLPVRVAGQITALTRTAFGRWAMFAAARSMILPVNLITRLTRM